MQETILIVYLVVAIALVGIILLQQGKGAEMGASFGAGGANTVFGAAGSGNALTKATTILAILFFGIALSISYINSAPPEVVDEVFDSAPAIKNASIEDELPKDPESAEAGATSSGIESELPPTETSNDKESAISVPVEEAEKAKTEKSEPTPKDGGQ